MSCNHTTFIMRQRFICADCGISLAEITRLREEKQKLYNRCRGLEDQNEGLFYDVKVLQDLCALRQAENKALKAEVERLKDVCMNDDHRRNEISNRAADRNSALAMEVDRLRAQLETLKFAEAEDHAVITEMEAERKRLTEKNARLRAACEVYEERIAFVLNHAAPHRVHPELEDALARGRSIKEGKTDE